jgi:hypothetical protein
MWLSSRFAAMLSPLASMTSAMSPSAFQRVLALAPGRHLNVDS